ncbi:TetR/AcrR family transcriptional regulator [Rubrimonas cliftonensis]|uniref:Transcriptional regulator, TetR family n=1 Tax=Rubrimonas cliftonensis TaxID=89524 RepID=A0A1H4FTH1_9RHOB|nr:TetR/AcrR family transcriptional regulator [Rubrimonas cliftonensis]SEA99822.1 transcriptional regulator, TetR family [Rubrimonas cliftonensis]
MRPDLTTALRRALFEEWSQTGYVGISLESVALRAGAGKAAIYRRWPSKLAFASDAIETVGVDLAAFSDCGSLEADLTAFLLTMRRALRHRLVRRILPDLLAERACSRDLAPLIDRLARRRRAEGERMLDRAVARGELRTHLDRELALDLIPSPLYWRMIVRERATTRAEVDRQARALVAALRAC